MPSEQPRHDNVGEPVRAEDPAHADHEHDDEHHGEHHGDDHGDGARRLMQPSARSRRLGRRTRRRPVGRETYRPAQVGSLGVAHSRTLHGLSRDHHGGRMLGRAQWALVILSLLCFGLVSCASPAQPESESAPPTLSPGVEPEPENGSSRGGGAAPSVKFELPVVGADYAQKDQWLERLADNCDEALHRRTQCLRLKFSFFSIDGDRKRRIRDPGPDYDSDTLGNCLVSRMSPEGRRGQVVPVDSMVSIEVICARPEPEQPPYDDEQTQPQN